MSAYVKHKAENWGYKTRIENEHVFKLALEIIGDKDIGLLTHEDFLRYRDVLKKLPANYQKKKEYKGKTIPEIMDMMEKNPVAPIAQKTRNKNLQGMSTLMKWCTEDKKYIQVNHAKGLATKDKMKGKDKRRPYDAEDIKALLASPVYTTEIPVERPERFWIPLIALFTGARLNEICSLHVEDVRSVEGVLCFDINQNTDDKTIKNDASERCIPVHSTLREAGFLEYLERLKQKGKERVFPNLNLTKANGYGGAMGKWFGRYSKEHVSQDPKKVFHSFRKSVANTLKQNSVDGKKIEEILGHTDNSMSTGYYADRYEPKVLYEALMKLDYGISFDDVRFPLQEEKRVLKKDR